MKRRNKGRDISGVIILDKPAGLSSSEAVQKAKRLFRARKVGHTGALDPLATGVLPLCFGEATKCSQFLLDSDKTYWVRIQLGVRTETGDADGAVVATRPVPELDEDMLNRALERYRGTFDQVPSMYSAIKHQGQPLYKLARQGIEVPREPRQVTVYQNTLERIDGEHCELLIQCSKGTYVRTIAEELGEDLGCGAHVTALRRLAAGPYHIDEAWTFEQLEARRDEGGFTTLDTVLLPVSSSVRDWPVIRLKDATAYYLKQGQPVLVPQAPTEGWVQLVEQLDNDELPGQFLGVGEILDDGRVAPRRLVVNH